MIQIYSDDFWGLLTQSVDKFPAGWVAVYLAAGLLGWAFRFRISKIIKKRRQKTSSIKAIHENETDISPINYEHSDSISEVARQWQKNRSWLISYWAIEDKSTEQLKDQKDIAWRYLPLEDRDLSYLDKMGVQFDIAIRRKGNMFDVLGLCEMPTALQVHQLRYFAVNTRDLSRTTAEREIRWLMEAPTNKKIWENRKIDPIQKVFFESMEIDIPTSMKATDAEKIIRNVLQSEEGSGSAREDWFAFEGIYNDLSSDYMSHKRGVRRPDPEQAFAAFNSLRKEGVTAMDQYIQIDIIVKRLVRMYPRLKM